MNKNELKELLFDEFEKHNDYYEIIEDLRSLTTEKIITDEEYDTILDNYNKWLMEYESEAK